MTLKRKEFAMHRFFILLSVLFISGCAVNNVDYSSLGYYKKARPILRIYSRNGAVCTPTLLGNTIGFVVASPIWLIAGLANSKGYKTVAHTGFTLAATPPLIGGFITGTPFLPFSYLAPFDRDACKIKFHI